MSLLTLAACKAGGDRGSDPTPDPASASGIALKEAQDERAAYEAALKKANVFANTGELKPVENLVATYIDVATEDLEDMVAYETAATEGRLSTHLFLAKLKDGADTSGLQQTLAMAGIDLIGSTEDGAEVEVAISQGYIIMAAAPNGSDIVNKFALVLAGVDVESITTIYNSLSKDIST